MTAYDRFEIFKGLVKDQTVYRSQIETLLHNDIIFWLHSTFSNEVLETIDTLDKSYYMTILKYICKDYHNPKIASKIGRERLSKWFDNKDIESFLFTPKPLEFISFPLATTIIGLKTVRLSDSNIKLNSNLETKLNNTKALLDNIVNEQSYKRATKTMDYFNSVKYKWAEEYQAQNMSNAWLKFYEMISRYEMIPQKANSFTFFDNAAFPGSSILAVDHYVKTKTSIENYRWFASSLYDKDALSDSYDLYKNYKGNWMMSQSLNGDVTDRRVIEEYKRLRNRDVDLYISDLGFDVSKDYTAQEVTHVKYNIGQILLGLELVKEGGGFISKMYSFFSYTSIAVILMLSSCFEDFYICKPIASKPVNSEIYLLGKGYRYNNDVVSILYNALFDNIPIDSLTVAIFNINNKIKEYFQYIILYISDRQIRYIEQLVTLFYMYKANTWNREESIIHKARDITIDNWIHSNPIAVLKNPMNCRETILKSKNSQIEIEYSKWKFTQSILFKLKRISNSREISNILERWLLSYAQLGNIYSAPYNNLELNDKMEKEFVEKKIAINVSDIISMVNSYNPTIGDEQKVYCDPNIRYRDYKYYNTERTKYLLSLAKCKDVAILTMRYQTIINGGQQWGLIQSHYRDLYDLGVRGEGFASILNSRFLQYKDKGVCKICTLFPDIESKFGSIGPFFNTELTGSWQINPPFIESIIEKVINKVLSSLKGDLEVFLLLPDWKDLLGDLYSSRYLQLSYKLDKHKFQIETPENTKFSAPFNLVYFYLSKDSSKKEAVNRIFSKLTTSVSTTFPAIVLSHPQKLLDFSLFKVHKDSFYSCLRPDVIEQTNTIIKQFLGGFKPSLIVDGTAHIGCDTINLQKLFNCRVIAIEKDSDVVEILKENIKSFGLSEKIDVINEDFSKWKGQKCDLVYLDPPWGGKDYIKDADLKLNLSGIPIENIILTLLKSYTDRVIFKSPNNYNLSKIERKYIIKPIYSNNKMLYRLVYITNI